MWNTFVEGDNLDVLRSLAGRETVDLVYIDPPYNTGNEFAYRDDSATGRTDVGGMMRPRLEAAREVLAETGAIFVSIDDNEAAHLRLLMDEVFGEANFLAQIVVNLNAKGRQLGKGFATSHEYLLVYARDARRCVLDASSTETVDPSGLPAGVDRRPAVPAPAAAEHQQEVQPRHRAHPALPGVRRPGVGPRGGHARSTAPSRSSRCSVTARPAVWRWSAPLIERARPTTWSAA